MRLLLFTFSFLIFSITNCFGQIQSHLSRLLDSDSDCVVAEITIIHRARADASQITELGSQLVIIPNVFNGSKLKMEYYRFDTREGQPFYLDEEVYIPVYLYFDNETVDPRDDAFLLSIPFVVDSALVAEEMKHYGNQEILQVAFSEAPNGALNYSIDEVVRLQKKED